MMATTKTMVMGGDDDDDGVDGDGAMGNEVNNDGNGAMGNEVNDDGDGTTDDDNDDDGDGNSAMGSGATGYDDAQRKGDDPMEGDRGAIPPQYCGGIH